MDRRENPQAAPWSWAAALSVLALVLLTAAFRPAYRAAHVDPVTVLRGE